MRKIVMLLCTMALLPCMHAEVFSALTRVDTMSTRITVLIAQNKIDSALMLAQKHYLQCSQGGDSVSRPCIDILRTIGMCYSKLQQEDSAATYYLTALERIEAFHPDDSLYHADMLTTSASSLGTLGAYADADSLLRQALSIYAAHSGDTSQKYLQCEYLSIKMQMRQGRGAEALPRLRSHLERLRSVVTGPTAGYADVLALMGTLLDMQGEYDAAYQFVDSAVSIIKKLHGTNSMEYARAMMSLGYHYMVTDNDPAGLGCYRDVERIYQYNRREDTPDYINVLYNIGAGYLGVGDHKSAARYMERALQRSRVVYGMDHPYQAFYLRGLGEVYQEMGDNEASEVSLRAGSLLTARVYGSDNPEHAISLYLLGKLFIYTDRLDSAEWYLRQALNVRRATLDATNNDYMSSVVSMGALFFMRGQYDSAQVYLQQIIASATTEEQRRSAGYLSALSNMGHVYSARGFYADAIRAYREVVDVSRVSTYTSDPENVYGNALFNLGYEYILQQQPDSAFLYLDAYLQLKRTNLRENLMWLSTRERNAYWKQQDSLYRKLISAAVELKNESPRINTLSFNAMMLSKALLLESSRETYRAVREYPDTNVRVMYSDLQRVRRSVSKMMSEGVDDPNLLNRSRRSADSLDERLSSILAEYADAQKSTLLEWTDIRVALDTSAALVEYAYFYDDAIRDNQYFAFVARREWSAPRLVRLGRERDLRIAIVDQNFEAQYDLLWKPLETMLNNVTTVYYSPAGAVHNVSLAGAFVMREDPLQGTQADVTLIPTYASDSYVLRRVTSSRSILRQSTRRTSKALRRIALYGGIQYDLVPTSERALAVAEPTEQDKAYRAMKGMQPVVPLPSTITEVDRAAAILRSYKWTADVVTGEQATESRIKQSLENSQWSVVHVATHGYAFPEKGVLRDSAGGLGLLPYRASEEPMVRSGLMMSGSNLSWTGRPDSMIQMTGEDGILTSMEVADMNLSGTELVVLSACKTGIGKIESNEGTYGLLRALKLAGVSYVIVSLWTVPDQETMELMTTFYEEYARTENPVRAFDLAQAAMRKRYPDEPERWAAFVLVQ